MYNLNFRLEHGTYKSITAPFLWWDIPMFAVVSGKNGVGKTQLLELMYDSRRQADEIAAKKTNYGQATKPGTRAKFTSFSDWLRTTASHKPWGKSCAAWLDGDLYSHDVVMVDSDWIGKETKHTSSSAAVSYTHLTLPTKA